MMMEITFKTLDRVTVNGLYNKNTVADITNFAYCVEDNTYYLLDDPIVLQKREDIEVTENGYKIVIKDEAKVSIITCNTLKDVYKQLINRLVKNDLNPFILYKKFKEGYVTGNAEIDSILVSTDIPDDIIEEMIEDIAKAEENHPEMLIYISIDILKGVDEVLKKIKENKELLKDKHMTIKDIINDITVKGDNYIAYPRKHTLEEYINLVIDNERKKLERLMKKQEQQQHQQQASTNQSSSGQQQQLEGGTAGSGSTGTAGSNAGMQGSPSPSPKPNTGSDNNNNNSSDNIGSSSGSGSLQLYAYTLRIITPYSLSRTKLNEAVTCLKRLFPDAKVEVV
jgi:hypothetical protein